MKECNREIMTAAWNILRIQYFRSKTVDKQAKEKIIEAYTFEKNHSPESNTNYDILIEAFNNL